MPQTWHLKPHGFEVYTGNGSLQRTVEDNDLQSGIEFTHAQVIDDDEIDDWRVGESVFDGTDACGEDGCGVHEIE